MGLYTNVVTVCLLILVKLWRVGGVTVHYLHWNTSNPIFRIDNTDHIVDVNQGNHQTRIMSLVISKQIISIRALIVESSFNPMTK